MNGREGAEQCVESALRKLEAWVRRNGWAGWDPYDVLEHPLLLLPQRWYAQHPRSRLAWLARGGVLWVAQRFPLATRRLLRVQPRINAKGMALFALAYLTLYQATRQEAYRARAQECLDWLETNPSWRHPGLGWGYPFDWQSLVFIPRGTPSGVVTNALNGT